MATHPLDKPLAELPPEKLADMIRRACDLAFTNKQHTLRLLGIIDQAIGDIDAGQPEEARDILREVQASWPIKDR